MTFFDNDNSVTQIFGHVPFVITSFSDIVYSSNQGIV